uniref:Uncharacterized protein n=1 Tax=uncultured marine microorganism HF4000_APKG2H5 TaxID=455545 RepID=B3T6F4_9ZZZZ|nr:hypothetical protein ALOHA_HF4000APKG2H5ctg1g9 [uncultured marine microorganism HF4000_APKG2H5]
MLACWRNLIRVESIPTPIRKSQVLARNQATVGCRTMPELRASEKVIACIPGCDPSGSGTKETLSPHALKSGHGGSSGSMKYSSSAMLNSRSRIMPCRGLISFRYPLPVWIAPKGSLCLKCLNRTG